ncbi:hypothetical protein [Cereibacter johrii]|uniref:hypothetical protein n=1 Tax=Cereibacter johrii TaxID=445629 RepID=UPI003CF5C5ED
MTERDFHALADRKGPGPLLTSAHPSVDPSMPALTMAGASDGRADLHDGPDRAPLGLDALRRTSAPRDL